MSSDDEMIELAHEVDNNLRELYNYIKSRINDISFHDLQLFIGEDHSDDTFAGDIYGQMEMLLDDIRSLLYLYRKR